MLIWAMGDRATRENRVFSIDRRGEVVGSGAGVADHADDGDGDGDGPSGRWVLGGFLVHDQAAGHRGFP